jgi:hypothetical protein
MRAISEKKKQKKAQDMEVRIGSLYKRAGFDSAIWFDIPCQMPTCFDILCCASCLLQSAFRRLPSLVSGVASCFLPKLCKFRNEFVGRQ